MPMWVWVIVGVVVAGLFVAAGVVYRLIEVRRAGTPVLLRSLPADADQGWRHGSVQYGDDALAYYRLSSLRPGPTVSLSRRRIEIVGRRAPVGTELEIMDADFASESAAMTKNSMLMQSGISMLKQAGQMPGMVMSLLG